MQTRILVLVAALGTAGCATTTQHRVAAAPPAAPASAANTAAVATPSTSAAQPMPQAQQATKFYTPTGMASPMPSTTASSTGPAQQAVQPVQPLYQSNASSQTGYGGTAPQGYAQSGLNSDPDNPSGAPGDATITETGRR